MPSRLAKATLVLTIASALAAGAAEVATEHDRAPEGAKVVHVSNAHSSTAGSPTPEETHPTARHR